MRIIRLKPGELLRIETLGTHFDVQASQAPNTHLAVYCPRAHSVGADRNRYRQYLFDVEPE